VALALIHPPAGACERFEARLRAVDLLMRYNLAEEIPATTAHGRNLPASAS
jgi:hypothetical protein